MSGIVQEEPKHFAPTPLHQDFQTISIKAAINPPEAFIPIKLEKPRSRNKHVESSFSDNDPQTNYLAEIKLSEDELSFILLGMKYKSGFKNPRVFAVVRSWPSELFNANLPYPGENPRDGGLSVDFILLENEQLTFINTGAVSFPNGDIEHITAHNRQYGGIKSSAHFEILADRINKEETEPCEDLDLQKAILQAIPNI